MTEKKSLLFRVILLFIAIFAITSFITDGPTYFLKDYFKSEHFDEQEEAYILGLNSYVLNPINKEATINAISVSDEEIDYYRNYYGPLASQIQNIEEQYAESLSEANSTSNEEYFNSLMKERDAKIADVQKNFDDDAYVAEKIKAEKLKILNEYLGEYESSQNQFLNTETHYYYFLKDQEGNVVQVGDQSEKKIVNKKVKVNASKLGEMVDTHVPTYHYGSSIGLEMAEPMELIRESKIYTGNIFITGSSLLNSEFQGGYDAFEAIKRLYYVIWLVGIGAIVLLATRFKIQKQHFEPFTKVKSKLKDWPIDVILVIALVSTFFFFKMMESLTREVYNFGYTRLYTSLIDLILSFGFTSIIGILLLSICFYFYWNFFTRMKQVSLDELPKQLMLTKIVLSLRDLFLNRSIGVQTLFLFGVFFLGGFGALIGLQGPQYIVLYGFLFTFVLLPSMFVYLGRMSYLNKVMKQTEKMAAGELTTGIAVKGNSPIAKHASNLNALQEGVKKSVIEQAKSERLKTELITNVSHDLRTPLTSIITYTDLLKNPHLSDEERAKYVDILDKKSERLKVLIEDLFEVSKMASGNVELVKNEIDVAQLVQQIAGEHSEDFQTNQLDLRTVIESQPVLAYADAQKLYRVFDNFFINALKYSLPGTRVYVTLAQQDNNILFTMKNVSKYELAGEIGELTERFKRADLARHTEGSGLGLAIASSIIDLHQGTLQLETDGDLFKLSMTLPKKS
jgi:signal transduction histidine kinase